MLTSSAQKKKKRVGYNLIGFWVNVLFLSNLVTPIFTFTLKKKKILGEKTEKLLHRLYQVLLLNKFPFCGLLKIKINFSNRM